MTEEKFLNIVSQSNANIDNLWTETIENEWFRELVIKHLTTNDKIDVYYHSYLIILYATKEFPIIFYPYWNEIAQLLFHENSYHRKYASDIIANLICIDTEERFPSIFDIYYRQLDDQKISNKSNCILNSIKIVKHSPKLSEEVIQKIINSLQFNENTEKQQNYLLSIFNQFLNEVQIDKIETIGLVLNFLNLVNQHTQSEKVKKEIAKLVQKFKKQWKATK
jgi:hypothetical protein